MSASDDHLADIPADMRFLKEVRQQCLADRPVASLERVYRGSPERAAY
jgi:hypothetical protein